MTLGDRLRALGSRRYHHQHPFNLLMHAGRLSPADLERWVANRYYYQTRIPIKDALILAKAEDPGFRRVWMQRLLDHDGRDGADDAGSGGLALWLRLGRATGSSQEELEQHRKLLPEVREVCDEYVELVRRADLVTAVASSLTECFAGDLMSARIAAWRRHYAWVAPEALRYFEQRVAQSAVDARFALRYVEQHARDPEQQRRCLAAFGRKCEILWTLLDAVYLAGRRQQRPSLTRRVELTKPDPRPDAGGRGRPRMLLLPEKALELNDSAARLVEQARGERTLAEITAVLATEHGVTRAVVERDVATFVAELERRRVLTFEPAEDAA